MPISRTVGHGASFIYSFEIDVGAEDKCKDNSETLLPHLFRVNSG